jgi:hypothetical protein
MGKHSYPFYEIKKLKKHETQGSINNNVNN